MRLKDALAGYRYSLAFELASIQQRLWPSGTRVGASSERHRPSLPHSKAGYDELGGDQVDFMVRQWLKKKQLRLFIQFRVVSRQ